MKAFIYSLKRQPCADCGGTFDPVCMDFDHRPDEIKLFQIGCGHSGGIEALKREIAKCDLVCANCHRVRTLRLRDHRRNIMEGQASKRAGRPVTIAVVPQLEWDMSDLREDS